jgi:hypothetical protein
MAYRRADPDPDSDRPVLSLRRQIMASRFSTLMRGDGVTTGEVHWSAVIAGVIVALVGQVLLTLLGAGLGAATFDPAPGGAVNDERAAMAAFALWAVAGIASGFAGGWTAGWVAGSAPSVDRIEGAFQAFLAWAVSTLIIAVLVFGIATGSALSTRLGGPMAATVTVERAAEGSEAAQETVADTTAKATLASFFALLIGAIAAMGGGTFGVANAKRMIADSAASARPAVKKA